jgi:predicted GIY-YIG superfamily endonuclease
VVFTEFQDTRGQALKREAAIKAMTREEKLGLIGTE